MKKLIAVSISVVILFLTTICVCAENKPIYGDVTGDETVSILDATEIQLYLVSAIKLDATALRNADVDSDSKVSIMDATYIQKYLAYLIDRFPSEDSIKPTAGLDDDGYNNEIVRP